MSPAERSSARSRWPDRATLAAAAVVTTFLGGCGSTEPASGEVELRTLERTPISGIAGAEQAVARTPQAWAALWARHAGPRIPAAAAPAVDFDRSQVVAVFLGTRPSACQVVTIRQVVDVGGTREVRYFEHQPGPTELCAALVVTPAHLVEVPRADLPVAFVKVAESP